MNKKRTGLRTWVEIDTQAIKRNYNIFKKKAGENCKIMAVVKSNAYGHGLVGFSNAVEKAGADWLGVDSVVEALSLRKSGIKNPILVLGYTLPERFDEAKKNNISITISSSMVLRDFKKSYQIKQKLPNIHLKIDTGMHRQGFMVGEALVALKYIKEKFPKDILEGVYTHFASAKNPSFPGDINKQIEVFRKVLEHAQLLGYKPMAHASATSGALVFPHSLFDLIRIGIGMYGLWPSKEVGSVFKKNIKLGPVLSWRTIVSEVKSLPKGSKIGYDFTETLYKNSRIAVIPVGYWHGYPRSLSSIGHVLIKGRRARVLGRVSMDMVVVDVTGVKDVKAGDVVTLIGRDGREQITADELADLAGTVNYEIVTRINPLIERIYF